LIILLIAEDVVEFPLGHAHVPLVLPRLQLPFMTERQLELLVAEDLDHGIHNVLWGQLFSVDAIIYMHHSVHIAEDQPAGQPIGDADGKAHKVVLDPAQHPLDPHLLPCILQGRGLRDAPLVFALD
jgi:hypothetical protein